MASNTVNIQEMLGNELLARKEGNIVPGNKSQLDGKYVGLYFSAHWCPPCRAFTPRLRKTYMMLLAKGKPFEVVFVSSDSSEEQFKEYYSEMPWMAVPFHQTSVRHALSRHFGVSGIPSLIIISPDGQVVNRNARAALIKDPEAERFPWEGEEETRYCEYCSLQ